MCNRTNASTLREGLDKLRAMVAVTLGATLLLLVGCSSGSPRTPARTTSGPPQVFEQACKLEGRSVCNAVASGAVPTKLIRPLHFPHVAGGHCPASPTGYVSTPDFGSMALGRGPVRVGVDNPVVHGIVHPGFGDFRGWLGIKTHFFSVPAYQGPFLVRAKRLDRPGPVRLGSAPTQAGPYVALAGRTYRDTGGWREAPDATFIKTPGCYGWQVDGLTFSEDIVARVGDKFHFSPGS
jgi:hypothetical protein